MSQINMFDLNQVYFDGDDINTDNICVAYPASTLFDENIDLILPFISNDEEMVPINETNNAQNNIQQNKMVDIIRDLYFDEQDDETKMVLGEALEDAIIIETDPNQVSCNNLHDLSNFNLDEEMPDQDYINLINDLKNVQSFNFELQIPANNQPINAQSSIIDMEMNELDIVCSSKTKQINLTSLETSSNSYQKISNKRRSSCTNQSIKKRKIQTGGVVDNLSANYKNLKNNPENKSYKIIETKKTIPPIKKFHIEEQETTLALNIKTGRTFKEANDDILEIFNQIHTDFVKPLDGSDFIKIVITHNYDTLKDGVYVPFMLASELTPKMICDKFDKIVQSYNLNNVELQVNQIFKVKTIVKFMPKGGVYKRVEIDRRHNRAKKSLAPQEETPMLDFLMKTPSIKKVYNTDNLCLLRAVIIAKSYMELKSRPFEYLCDEAGQRSLRFTKKLLELCVQTNIPITRQTMCGNEEAAIIERVLQDYQIVIFRSNFKNKEFVYLNESKKFNKYIYLCLHEEHYYVVTSMTAFLDRSYFCHQCKQGFKALGQHTCEHTCKFCQRLNCIQDSVHVCLKCKAKCRNTNCFNRHAEKVCLSVTNCNVCHEKKLRKHVCGENSKWCENCYKSVDMEHRCFILTEQEALENLKKRSLKYKEAEFLGYIFFDYECYQGEDGNHVPNLIIASKCCVTCLNSKAKLPCCKEVYKFYDNEKFCQWLFGHANFIAIAHNLKGYDGVFIANYCINNQIPTAAFPKMIATPTKLLQILFNKVKIIDSYSFLAMALEQFPKTFGLTELKKGFFPHKFNTPDNMDYEGQGLPEKRYYGSEYFSITKHEEFEQFYAENKDNWYNNKRELEEYCLSDVKILEEGCLKFREIVMKQTGGVDPFRVAITIASLCNYIYRRNYMPKNSIGIIPDNGYNPNLLASKKCERWLQYISQKENINIQRKSNGGEKKVLNYYLDGYCLENKKIYEFNGDFFHGCNLIDCSRKINPITWNPMKNCTMKYLNYLTNKKAERIKQVLPEFEMVTLWECEYDRMCEEDENFKYFISNNKIKEPLIPRAALKGGRVNAFKLYHKCKSNEKIKYQDFTSLYPSVQKKEKFPIGHPTIINNVNKYVAGKYFGLVKCTFVAPRNLYAPILPATIKGKLLFALCNKCATEQSDKKCNHSNSERAISGTFCTVELDYAVKELGYIVISVDEIWHWSESGDLFSEYVNACIKEKQEASGWPSYCTTEEEKKAYIDNYYEKEGIQLDYHNIKKNSGARSVAKIKANSQWGYMAMNTNKSKHKFIRHEYELNEMLLNNNYTINNIIPCQNFQSLQVYYSETEEYHIGGLKTNVAIASFVTSYGRLRLYEQIRALGERVIYFDTDSIFFISIEGKEDQDPPTGELLGEFTNELKDGEHIVEFVSAGPKNYAYKLNTGETHCTVKGFTLNMMASLKITFESIKKIVTEDQEAKICVPQLKFSRDNKKWNVRCDEEEKYYGFVYDKRVLKENFTTLPYGY